jgi:hypothetical protein
MLLVDELEEALARTTAKLTETERQVDFMRAMINAKVSM